jgi:ABC-type nickel/cobalt efflux system permease component RcnA
LSAKKLAQPPATDIHSILPLLNPTIFCFKTFIKSEAKITQKKKEEKKKEAKITNTILKYHIEKFSTKGKFLKTFFFLSFKSHKHTHTHTNLKHQTHTHKHKQKKKRKEREKKQSK